MKALAKDVEDRYQYANDLAEDLRSFMYSTGNPFSRKDLSAFMKATFAEDFEAERNRLQGYAEIQAPEGMLVSAELGYGVGALPAAGAFGPSGSAVTSIPTHAPVHLAPLLQFTPASNGLPPIARPLPPSLSPPAGPGVAAVPLSNLPRLTAAAPLLSNDERQATVMSSPFPDDTRPAPYRPGPELSPDPVEAGPAGGWGTPQEPVPTPRTSPAASAPRRPPLRLEAPVPASQPVAASPGSALEPPRNTSLYIVLAGIVALLIIGVVMVVVLKPPATGILVIDVPTEARGSAQVSINGQPVPNAEWPMVRQVKVGKAVVLLSAPGYESVVETVEVKDSEPAALQKELKKSGR
jgi:hypothetical protein